LAPRSGTALAEWLSALTGDPELARALRHHALLPAGLPERVPGFPLDSALASVLRARGIDALYRHQARAI
jgi:hypothetical protein